MIGTAIEPLEAGSVAAAVRSIKEGWAMNALISSKLQRNSLDQMTVSESHREVPRSC